MYYLEDTTPSGKITELHTMFHNYNLSVETTLVPIETDKSDGYTGHSMLLLILLSVLLIILLLCCITACIIAKSRSKQSFFAKGDIECSPGCSGVNVPLLGLEKTSNTTTKTSSMKDWGNFISVISNLKVVTPRIFTHNRSDSVNYHRHFCIYYGIS